MARNRSVPDAQVFGLILAALQDNGEKAVSFGQISIATGLAPATLADRYGSVEAMQRAALAAEWDRLEASLTEAAADAGKGAQGLLKTLAHPSPAVLAASLRDPALQARALHWRRGVEDVLAARRGGGARGLEAAAMIFAAWQGRQLWQAAGAKPFRLADVMKRLG